MQTQKDTLFLDRDGVINVQLIGDYVKNVSELEIREDFLLSAPLLRPFFRRMIVVTNQQGIAKGICSVEEVENVHSFLLQFLLKKEIIIDKIYYCPHLNGSGCACRKPEIGMARQAKADFPEIDFENSVMIGDSYTDMLFGKNCGMGTVFLSNPDGNFCPEIKAQSDYIVSSIYEYTKML